MVEQSYDKPLVFTPIAKMKRFILYSCCFYFQILQPTFTVIKSLLSDILKNKLMEEALETLQDIINHVVEVLPEITEVENQKKSQPSIFKHVLSLHQENITAFILFLK